ncbi:hypothetical protein L210DRAFT_3504841 [Boletus edulis BED1]|uniref:Uncharacterized protein n=1 Tax=Boletus edulis BED1 TaxID=1328754 RepID=A0AAD4BSN6_BOLED|nr:hypothetical protein L210DRAFT_3504841 [Boletus edulis BED1]
MLPLYYYSGLDRALPSDDMLILDAIIRHRLPRCGCAKSTKNQDLVAWGRRMTLVTRPSWDVAILRHGACVPSTGPHSKSQDAHISATKEQAAAKRPDLKLKRTLWPRASSLLKNEIDRGFHRGGARERFRNYVSLSHPHLLDLASQRKADPCYGQEPATASVLSMT